MVQVLGTSGIAYDAEKHPSHQWFPKQSLKIGISSGTWKLRQFRRSRSKMSDVRGKVCKTVFFLTLTGLLSTRMSQKRPRIGIVDGKAATMNYFNAILGSFSNDTWHRGNRGTSAAAPPDISLWP